MPTLKEVLADKAGYTDNLAWTLGNGVTVTLGQLRELSTAQQNAVSKAEGDLATKQAKLDADNAELRKAQTNAASAFQVLTNAEAALKAGRYDDPAVKQLFGNATPPPVPGSSNDPFATLARLEQDTIMGPLVTVIKTVRAEALKAQEAVAANVAVQKTMATNYMNGVLEDRYDRIVPVDKQDKISLESLIRDAVAHNEFSADSTPNIRKAYKRATAVEDAAASEAKIREDERNKVIAELGKAGQGNRQNGIFVGQPQAFGLDVHNRSGKAPQAFKSLDEAFAAAEKDPTIWESPVSA